MESGLKTEDSLNKLYVEIDTILHQYETSRKDRNSKSWLKDALHFKSQHSTVNIFSIIFGLWTSISLLLGYILEGDNVGGYEAIPILLLIVLNISLEIYDNKLRHNEIPNKIRHVLDKLKSQQQNIKWSVENYPNLNSPISPCITLQWTFRDGQLVNLPWALLVKDDIILLRPGQASPGYCESLDKHSEFPLLHAKEIFCPSLQNANENFSTPKFRKPLEPKKYRLLETPYLNNLKIFLEKALDRPVSQLNQQRHLVTMRIVEQILLPLTFFLVLVVNLFRYFYFHKYLGRYLVSNTMFIVPCNVVLPLLPMVFPLFWNIANYLGIARFKTIFDITTKPADKDSELAEDTDIVTEDLTYIDITKKDIFKNFINIFKGKPEILSRSTNILHVLGSVSAFGCVDKKGILSWPNPTAEKVFFLHNEDDVSQSSSMDNINDLAADHEPTVPIGSSKNAVFEVLDVTHKSNDPFKLYFDEPDWKEHISSLKPLGLAILLNTCNIDTQDNYTLFCSHITCEAVYNENLVPVTNRRCLCEVAKEIGFVDEARKIFTLEEQLSSFRHLQPEMVRKDNKYARSLQLSTKLKFPFPNTFAVVVKEQSTGNEQLFSEGTADLVLDSCVEYWNGHDLIPLSISDKKRILDFYQRCSLTAYCTAFSYRPLSPMIHSKLSDVYLEVPSDSRHLYMSQRSPTPMQWEFKKILDPTFESSQQFVSTDSLLFNDNSTIHVSDAETCFQIQCNQIFIGMVTMQYQAMTDIVHLIEQLERACIRFVHFSKENELRSRVFNEKMGLESGWNCHISLLSERNSNLESSRTMSFSAPSAINTDYSVVKFDTEVDRINIELKQSECGDTEFTSQESIPLQADSNTHEWQSLSNMTESTEQSVPINFDMSNRAKLPRGIDKIRPHIEFIDNVPLLVSLYTDCTPDVTKEMLKIMQEYKEIVCIIGSSENCDNAGIFMQADASISIEPLFTQVCQKKESFKKPTGCLSPIDFSFELNSIPCSLSVKRRDPFSIFRLIMESRHFVASLWNSGQFWLCSCVSLSVLQMLATFVMLPGLLTTGQVLWFSCVVVPLISISLLFRPVDSNVMKKPQGKMQAVCNWDAISFILWCYGTKFLTTFAVVLISFVGILTSHCDQICNVLPNCTCAFYYNPVIFTEEMSMGGWDENEWTLLTARLIISFIILLHLVTISSGFIHRNHSIFKRSPHSNFFWLSSVFILIIIQSVYTLVVYTNIIETQKEDRKFEIPIWIIGFAAVSPLLVWIVNELVKKQEIMVNDRFLKRARLDFGTKLGMNSPF